MDFSLIFKHDVHRSTNLLHGSWDTLVDGESVRTLFGDDALYYGGRRVWYTHAQADDNVKSLSCCASSHGQSHQYIGVPPNALHSSIYIDPLFERVHICMRGNTYITASICHSSDEQVQSPEPHMIYIVMRGMIALSGRQRPATCMDDAKTANVAIRR